MKKILSMLLVCALMLQMTLPVKAANNPETVLGIESSTRNAQVRTHYQTTPFVGKPSDYTYLLSSTKGNLYKDIIIGDIETSIMATSIGFLCMSAAIAMTVAGAIQSAVKANAKALYYKDCLYAMKGATNVERDAYQKRIVWYYTDANYTQFAYADIYYIENVYW